MRTLCRPSSRPFGAGGCFPPLVRHPATLSFMAILRSARYLPECVVFARKKNGAREHGRTAGASSKTARTTAKNYT